MKSKTKGRATKMGRPKKVKTLEAEKPLEEHIEEKKGFTVGDTIHTPDGDGTLVAIEEVGEAKVLKVKMESGAINSYNSIVIK